MSLTKHKKIKLTGFVRLSWKYLHVYGPVIVDPTVQLGVLDEAGVMEEVAARAALDAVLVVGHVHDPQQEAVAYGPAAHAAQTPHSCSWNKDDLEVQNLKRLSYISSWRKFRVCSLFKYFDEVDKVCSYKKCNSKQKW